MKSPNHTTSVPLASLLSTLSVAVMLSACGGQSSSTSSTATQQAAPAAIATATTTFDLVSPIPQGLDGQQIAKPAFYLAPVELSAPSNVDAYNNDASASKAPALHHVPEHMRGFAMRGATLQQMQAAQQSGVVPDAAGKPAASTGVVTTYTPAQIRSAYSLPSLPTTAAMTAAQAAALGAGQTIYIVDAYNDPNVIAELAAFNTHFGLMGCTTVNMPASTKLPLAAAPTTGCQFSVVYSSAAGTLSSASPANDAGWATEIALDVEWAHATAPMARIILIEAPDASSTSFSGAISLANAMGPGAVSMSFGAPEGSWMAAMDSLFATANMTYLAATGDNGTGVSWPSASSRVLAVGATTLNYSGTATAARSETAWSNTGGGVSAYVAAPSYQSSSVPGMGTKSNRGVADVAFNGDPNSGQYVAIINAGSSAVSWVSAGGTSLSTPQWAGIIAIANAQRALSGKAAVGAPHATLYTQIAQNASFYSSTFLDVTSGSDGSCADCSARVGYDEVTGLGTPNVVSLLSLLSGATSVAVAPVVTPATINGLTTTPLSFTVSVAASNAVTYSLTGAPSGMTINSSGAVTWATPAAGNYAVTVNAKDNVNGLSGSGIYTVKITVPAAPVVPVTTVNGQVGKALSATVPITAVDPITVSLTGAPAGLSISNAGVSAWATPVAGTYSVTVLATDTVTKLVGKGIVTIVIAQTPPPTITAATINGTVGTPLSFIPTVSASNPITFTLSGAPSGMVISAAGVVTWATPVQGSYAVTLTAKDSKTGLSGTGVFSVVIAAKTVAGPVITATTMTGVAGKPLSGTITITDKAATSMQVSITGMPMGVSFSPAGLVIGVLWSSPVTGTYNMTVTATDNTGATAKLVVPITIAAH